MEDRLEMAGTILSAATFFGGLVLAYIASAVTGYSAFSAEYKNDVRCRYQMRAWFGFCAFILCLASGVTAFFADWNNSLPCLNVAAWLLLAGGVCGAACALLTVLEID